MKHRQILLIEPDYLLALIYKEHLEKLNYSVKIASGAQMAINEIDITKPDIIVLEPQISSHNGYEFLYELRSYSDWQSLPILIHSMIPQESLGLNPATNTDLGIIGYLYKPNTSLGKLQYTLENLLLVNNNL